MYTAIYTILVALGLSVRRSNESSWLLALMAFFLWFMGARYFVGCDFTGYYSRFEGISIEANLESALNFHEPGFQLLMTAIRLMDLDYMWMNVAASAIILGGYYVFLRGLPNPLMIFALLFPVMIVQLSMSGIRQGIAVALLLVGATYFLRGQRVWTAIWIALAAQFHTSAAMFIPIAFLAGQRVSFIRLVIGVLALTPVAVYLMSERLEVYSDRYIVQIYGEMSSGGALFRYLLILIPAILFAVYYEKMREKFPRQYELLKLFTLITFALLPVYFLSSVALHRLTFYVMPFSIVSFVYVSSIIFPRTQQLIGQVMPAIVYGAYFIAWQTLSGHADQCYTPYQNYLFIGSDALF